MPTESTPIPPDPSVPGPSFHPPPPSAKCTLCGGGSTSLSLLSISDDTSDPNISPMDDRESLERLCASCVRIQTESSGFGRMEEDLESGIGLGLSIDSRARASVGEGAERLIGRRDRRRIEVSPDSRGSSASPSRGSTSTTTEEEYTTHQLPVPITAPSSPPYSTHSHSLPSPSTSPWHTTKPITALSSAPPIFPIPEVDSGSSTPIRRVVPPSSPTPPLKTKTTKEEIERLPNPVLDVVRSRIPSTGRGCLYPGSVFRGTQTSGRSAYEVEVKFLDVNLPDSTLCGYLSISHLTDSHPHLTTFFTAEIIGPKYGFLTGSRYGATEHDDKRHWGRFEQFRRQSTKADMVGSGLHLRDPPVDISGKIRERDFVFLRIKERFLVPDHRVRDISGASFAGFYFALVDLSPALRPLSDQNPTPTSPTSPTSPLLRRMSSETRRPSRSVTTVVSPPSDSPNAEGGRTREKSSSRVREKERDKVVGVGAATIRGYYFHSLNQEPFQELSLTHIPTRSSSTFEMR